MSLPELVSTVFRLGCDMSLETVLQSHDYHGLCQEARHLDLVDPDESALVQLLGTELAERAYTNLPASIRDKIAMWQDGLEAQLAFLELVCAELASTAWQESGTRTYEYNSDVRCVLPAQAGGWTDGPVKPNCLLVAQMMVGLARRLGARHFLANTLRANQDTLHAWKIRILQTTARALRQHESMGELAEKIEAAHVTALEEANTNHQAHHILIIETDDGTLWAVDPYLSTLYPLAPSPTRSAHLLLVEKKRNKMLSSTNPTPGIHKHLDMLETRLIGLQFMCQLVTISHEQPKPVDGLLDQLSHMAAYLWLCEKPMDKVGTFERRLSFAHARAVITKDDEQIRMAQFAMLYAVHDIEDITALAAMVEGSSPEMRAHLHACLLRAASDRTYEGQLAVRLVRFTLKSLMMHTDELRNHADARHHECLEIGWAPMALGIAMLNHMQFEDAGSEPTLQGQLVRLLRSQWAMYDALAIAQQRGEPIDPECAAIIEEYLARLEEAPELMIIPLLIQRQRK